VAELLRQNPKIEEAELLASIPKRFGKFEQKIFLMALHSTANKEWHAVGRLKSEGGKGCVDDLLRKGLVYRRV